MTKSSLPYFIFLFFAIPTAALIAFVVSLCRYFSAKKKNILSPGTYAADELKKRKTALIVWGIIAGILVAMVVGIIVLLFTAIAFM